MVGSVGSGRTSLLRCLGKEAPLSLHLDHIHASAPAKSLLESLYLELVGPNIPSHYTAIVSEMVETSKSFTGKLPLVVIDVPTVDSAVLNVALRDTLPVIERLQVLMVVVLDHKQKAHLPEAVLKRFDMVNTLNPLSVESIQELVNLRIRSACSTQYTFPKEDAEHLLAITDGLPASIIRVMRDAVDNNRMAQNQGAQNNINHISHDRKGFDTSAILPTQQPEASTTGIFTSKHDLSTNDLAPEPSIEENSDDAKLDASTVDNDQPDIFGGLMDELGDEYVESIEKAIDSSEDAGVEVMDASTPWQSRPQNDELNPETTQDDDYQEIHGPGGSLSGFDLDLDDLGSSKDNDAPLKETPFDVYDSDEINNETTKPIPVEMTGMFGSLVGRMREAPEKSPQNPDDYEQSAAVKGTELWVAKDSNLIDEPSDEELEGDGTAMLHDETGYMSDDVGAPIEAETSDESNYQDAEHLGLDSGFVSKGDMKTFSHLVNALQTALLAPQKQDGTIDRRRLIDALTSLRQPKVGERIDHPLNPSVLSNLSPHEAVVVATANERKYSPSDQELLQELNIKRARLSQISNRLHKGGILNARKVGKSRLFTLTQSARAQLTAWNMMGGEF
ncbi:MAG: helix-turn-helix domain-containing protein [Candidatus Poseidoniaceae archaeon]|nr:helix-turn-helix domain-containing protein [Candidatus Poseidoniaceae archaeon]